MIADHIAIVLRTAATGTKCSSRAPCKIVIVYGNTVLLDAVVRVDGLVSPLKMHTHLTADEIRNGEDWFEVRNKAQTIIDSYGTYVGHHLRHIHEWLDLTNGRCVELSDFFMTVENGKRSHYDLRTLCEIFNVEHAQDAYIVSDAISMWQLFQATGGIRTHCTRKLLELKPTTAPSMPVEIDGRMLMVAAIAAVVSVAINLAVPFAVTKAVDIPVAQDTILDKSIAMFYSHKEMMITSSIIVAVITFASTFASMAIAKKYVKA